MKKIYIIGGGGLAKEVFTLINDINKVNLTFDFSGFILPQPEEDVMNLAGNNYPVFKESDFLNQKKNVAVVNGIGNPKIICEIAKAYSQFDWPNLIHPNFVGISNGIKMGKGNVITAGNVFTIDIEIGSYNFFNLCCTLGHDSIIGDSNVFNPGCNISGGVQIGNRNLIGTNATILQYVNVGNDSVIGAATLVTKDIPSHQIHIGIPAKLFKEND